ncbi:MAG: prolyl oligopeptidase family serine peptidase [Phenylobacterium sp.]|nr:prolyl oligopeptidase family serine peptidase [Phenylobacterium sp.]MDP1875192.1 prolyl oligopeptidase family serine peptidase [Phenylobacterium sp.]
MRLARLGLALVCAAIAAQAWGRPFTIDDLLSAEEFGQMGFSPNGRHFVFERLGPQAQSGPFDQDVYSGYRRSQIFSLDRLNPGPAERLGAPAPGDGLVAGPFSPSGDQLAVLRLRGPSWEVGVAHLADGAVTWLGLSPELGLLGQTLVWRSETQLLVAARSEDAAPLRLRIGGEMRRTLTTLWTRAEAGWTPSTNIIGSGRYLSTRLKPPVGRLVQVDLATGEQADLLAADIYDLELSPDGQSLAVMIWAEDLQAPPDQPLWVASAARRRNLILIDLKTRDAATPCSDCHLETHLIAWAPQGREVLVYGQRRRNETATPAYLRLSWEGVRPVPLPGLRPIIDRTSEGYAIPRGAWLGGTPMILAEPPAGGRADWWMVARSGPQNLTADLPKAPDPVVWPSAGGRISVRAGSALYQVSPAAQPRRLFKADGLVTSSGLGLSHRHKVNQPRQEPWFRVHDLEEAQWRSLGGQALALSGTPLDVLARSVSAVGLAELRRTPSQALTLQVQWSDGTETNLVSLNEDFAHIAFAEAKPLQGRDPAGEAITHWLLLPPQLNDRRSACGEEAPPMVVIPYPGASYPTAPDPIGRGVGRYSVNPELLAAGGFAVLIPSLPRAPGQEPAEGLAAQILAAVDLAQATGEVDASRLGIMGQSFGGYSALMAATQSSRFRAVVASAAPSNLTSMRGAFDPHHEVLPRDGLELNPNYGWSELGQGQLGVSPWDDPAKYVRNSPVFFADQITAPVLLIHGDGDFVRLSQAQEMFSALYRLGKDAQLLTAYGEGHIISSPANRRAVSAHTLPWLQAVLCQGAEARPVAGVAPSPGRSPRELQSPLPSRDPELRHDEVDQDAIPPAPDEMIDTQPLLKTISLYKTFSDQAAFKQHGPQDRQALSDDLTVVRRQPSLGSSLGDLFGDTVGKGTPR